MKITFVAQFLFFIVLLWQPAAAQTSLCTEGLADNDDDGVAAAMDIDKDNDSLIEICDLEGINEMRYQLDGSGYTTSTEAVKNIQGCPTAGCRGYELVRSLDFNADADYRITSNKEIWTTGEGWQPIGSNDSRFSGIFEGNGFTISGLYINRPQSSNVGLFGVSHSEIKNIGLLDVNIQGGSNTGGLVGVSYGNIINSYASGAVSGSMHVGGLIGHNEGRAIIINSHATGAVTGTDWYIGGLVGWNEPGAYIINSYASGAVSGHFDVGGLVGFNQGRLRNTYATGDVSLTGASDNDLGGLVGEWVLAGSIRNSYAIGRVIPGADNARDAGGLIGNTTGTAISSYWDGEASGWNISAGGVTSRTTMELQSPTAPGATTMNVYYGWRDNDWDFGDDEDYPALRYIAGGMNACNADILTVSDLPQCGSLLPNQGRTASLVVSEVMISSQPAANNDGTINEGSNVSLRVNVIGGSGVYNFVWSQTSGKALVLTTTNTATLNVAIAPDFVEQDATTAAITFQVDVNDGISTISRSAIITINKINNSNPAIAVDVDVNAARLRIIATAADTDGVGSFSYQWQQLVFGGAWTNILNATTATYWLPADVDARIQYRVEVKHTDGQGYTTEYPIQGPFRVRFDDDGDGLIDIYTLEDLDAIRNQYLNIPDRCGSTGDIVCNGFELRRSLDFNVAESYQSGMTDPNWTTSTGWTPIGSVDERFNRVFEGNGFTISGLYINRPHSSNVGLFGVLSSEIKNIGLLDVNIQGGGNTGGLVGWGEVNTNIINSYASGTVNGYFSVGSLVGTMGTNGHIINSYATGIVTGTGSSIGGLVGSIGTNDHIINSYATGAVTGTGSSIGGLVGFIDTNGHIINSYASGAVSGEEQVGGLVGWNQGRLRNVYATGDVSLTSASDNRLGGLVGGWLEGGSIRNSYAIGGVIPGANNARNAGGLIGVTTGTAISSYWDGEASDWNISAGGVTSRTTMELQLPTAPGATAMDIYYGWRDNNWDFGDDEDYPALRYIAGGMNACNADMSTPSDLPRCGSLLANQGRTASLVVSEVTTSSQPAANNDGTINEGSNVSLRVNVIGGSGVYNFVWSQTSGKALVLTTTNTATLNVAIAPDFVEQDATTAAITFQVDVNDGISTISRSAIIAINKINNGIPAIAVDVDVNAARLRIIATAADTDGVGSFSYQWQQLVFGGAWTNILNATTATYWLPADVDARIQYRVEVKHTDGQGYTTEYPIQGPFRVRFDDDNDGLIDIYTLEDLDAIRHQYLNIPDRCGSTGDIVCNGFELRRSLDFNAVESYKSSTINTVWTTGRGWLPIGLGDSTGFGSVFEGNGYTLSGLYINSSNSGMALFFVLNATGQIKNVGLLDVDMRGSWNTAGLVAANNGSIINSYATGKVSGSDGNIGGLVGENGYTGSIRSSFAKVRVSGRFQVGGLVGLHTGRITNSYAAGTVSATSTGDASVGGLVGGVGLYDGEIINSYAVGRVISSGGSNVGGLVGKTTGTVIVSYWDTQTSKQSSSAGGDGAIARSTVQLQSPTAAGTTSTDTYYSWSDKVWDFGDDEDYPALRYIAGGMNACTDMSTPSDLPQCGSLLPNQGRTKEAALVVSEVTTSSQPAANNDGTINEGSNVRLMVNATGGSGTYNFAWSQTSGNALLLTTTHTATLNVAIPPDFIELDAATAAITFQVEVSDGISTTSRSAIITIQKINNGNPLIEVDVNPSRLRVIAATADTDGAGSFSYQWQQLMSGGWTDITDATTATYWLPADAVARIQYRVNVEHTDGQRYTTNYPTQGPFEARLDDDNDGLIDIYTLEDLDEIRNQYASMPSTCAAGNAERCRGFELRRSLDFNAIESYQSNTINTVWTTGSGWTPIGSVDERFNRVFEGNGFTISGLYINRPQSSNVGLFGVLSSEIKNIGLLDVNIQGGNNTGGLVGSVSTGHIINSYATGAVTGMDSAIGGLIGSVDTGHIINSYASGAVSGLSSVGGLVGWNQGHLRNVYATGDVSLTSASDSNLGGLVGDWIEGGSIRNSYAIGRVIPGANNARNAGGLIGNTTGTAISSYWDGEASDWNISAGGVTSRTTAQMKSPIAPGATPMESYYGWGNKNWDFGSSEDYPILRYVAGSLNACNADISTPSDLPQCGSLLPNQGRTKEAALVVSEVTTSSQPAANNDGTINEGSNVRLMVNATGGRGVYNFAWSQTSGNALLLTTTHTATLNVAIPPDFIELDAATAAITFQVEVSDGISITSRSAIITIQKINNGNPLIEVDVNPSRLRVITTTADTDGAGSFSYQWQQLMSGGWTDITDATTATYWLPADAVARIQYRVNVEHTDGQGYTMNYPTQGPFEARLDDDNDGLIDIYTLEDLDEIRNQYRNIPNRCGDSGDLACGGFELRRSLNFKTDVSYQTTSNKVIWTTEQGWQPIGSNANRFGGIFDGNGFTIRNLYMDREASDLGLFSVLGTAGEIKNVRLLNISVRGHSRMGGLVGESYGSIINSYATGEVAVTGVDRNSIGGLIGLSRGSIINSYATVNVTGSGLSNANIGGLVGESYGSIINSYATGRVRPLHDGSSYIGGLVGINRGSITNSYATGAVSGEVRIGGLVGQNVGNVTQSYWDNSATIVGAAGVAKTTAELQSPTAATGIYSDWSSDDWDFGDSKHYPALRYAKGDNLNACVEITTSSEALPCGILIPNQSDRNTGLAGIFFFADGEPASVISDPLFSQGVYHYDMTIVASNQNIHIRPYALNDSAKIIISDQNNPNYFANKPNGALSDAISLEDNETILTVVITDTIDQAPTTYTFVIVRWLPLRVDVSSSRLSVIFESDDPYPDGGSFSYQWQQRVPGLGWTNIPGATTATYSLPAAANSGILYRVVDIKHTNQGGYIINYPDQGPFRAIIDNDGDGLIDIYYLEDLDAMRYQLNGRAYQPNEGAEPIMRGCPVAGCRGYELMRSLDFDVADSYIDSTIDTAWTASTGWQPIGSNANRFSSIFDGNGFTIRNLFMNRAKSDLGLFSVLGTAGEIKNVRLLNIDVEGHSRMGGLVGESYGSIINSYATGEVAVTRVNQNSIGGLVGFSRGSIINSYATVNVTGSMSSNTIMGGLVGLNQGSIINSYATGRVRSSHAGSNNIGGLVGINRGSITNSYATGAVSGEAYIGGLVGQNVGNVTQSYWDNSATIVGAAGVAKTTAELQSPTAATGIYSDWSSDDWDFGDSKHYPALRYAKGGDLNACATDITTSSEALPCGILIPNQSDRNTGLAGIFFFADGEPASVISDLLFSQGVYHYDMTIVASNQNIHIRPYALNDSAKIIISDQNNPNYFANKLNGALSDAISLEDSETILTVVITDIIDQASTTYTFVIVRWLPLRVDVSSSRLSVIFESDDPYPDGGSFSYQWQQRVPGLGWTNIPGATTATYSLPAAANSGILYRVVDIKHTNQGGYIINYPDQGPFRAIIDNDGDGLIDIYYLEDLDAMRYQLNGRAYQPNEGAEPIMRGCPVAGCRGYELMRSLDFDVADSYIDSTIDTAWTTSTGWQPIGSNANRFSSIFDGNGFIIRNLYMDREASDLGLFSVLGTAGKIKNVGLLDVSVKGSGNNIGGLVGRDESGSIINSYVTGDVSGTNNIGGLVGRKDRGSIINSYVTGDVSGTNNIGGLVGLNGLGSIINSYASGTVSGDQFVGGLVSRNGSGLIISSYAAAKVTGDSFVGSLTSLNTGSVVASYWDTQASGQAMSSGGEGKTKAELQSPTAATGIYSDWSSDDWDFGGNNHYPALRYAKGDNLNACVEITISSEALPCGILMPNQRDRNTGLVGIFFFADGEPASVISDPLFSQGIYHYDMTIVASNLNIHLRPYALNDSAKITISDQDNPNYFTNKPSGALSDAISLEDNETTLTIVVTDNMNEVSTTYTFVIVRLLPLRVDISRSRFSVILESAIPDPDGGSFSYQWQQQEPGSGWTNIPAATTATYSLPADADGSIRYRVIMWHTDGGDYITDYPTLGPFKASVDDDGDGLIDIYALEDLNAIRYQLDGRAYKANENADPLILGCPVTGCKGYELMQSLDFNADASYYTTSNKAIWTTGEGWQPIGSDANRFSSIFEGNGYTISNLFMNREEFNLGLFSVLHANGEIKNVGLLNVSVTGIRDNTGGVVGQNFGGIINSYVTGTVTVARGDNIGGLVGLNHNRIINSYATGEITGFFSIGGLVGRNESGSIINSYATGVVTGSFSIGGLVGVNTSSLINSYATGTVTGTSDIGDLVGVNFGRVIASYWDTQASGQAMSSSGEGKTMAELQSPTAATGIYSDWSSNNWDFGDSDDYPVLRYANGGNLNACTNNITTSSEVLPCGITLPNQRDRSQGLAGIFFFADGEPAEEVLDPLFSQGIDNYAMTIVASNLNIHLRPYALNDSAKITISDQYNPNYFADKPNGALSDAIGLKDSETILTIVVTDTINEVPVNTTYTFAIVRLLPIRVDVSRSRLSVIFESDDPYPDGGVFSYQWQQQIAGTGWTDIADATTATYSLPADADGSIRYRVINIKYTSRDRYIINYPNQGPFKLSVDDDGDGLIDIYTLEDLNAIRYQPNGRAYQSNRNTEPLMLGCPVTGCKGYELMQSLDFNADSSYYTTSNKAIWTTGVGWQPIGSNANRFSGIFEGNGFTIANLLMSREGFNPGLFSVLDTTGEIKNVGLLNISVRGRSEIGGLVGQNYGSIINSYITGNITGRQGVIGGLVATNRGTIINSYATGTVTGTGNIGGLVGWNFGSIINSYATGTVTGTSNIGGLVGRNHNRIINSYATGMITGNSNIGGLVGFDRDGSVTASYWNAETSDQLTSAGGNGVTSATTAQLQSPTTPGTKTTELYYRWSSDDWDFGDNNHYPALRYATDGNLNACVTDITTSSTALPCAILLPDQSGREQGLAGVFFFADGAPAELVLDPLFSQRIYSYNKTIVTTETAVQLTLRPYALNANATITITAQDNEDYFVGKPNGALSNPIMLSEPTTLTLVVTDTINEVLVNTTYTVTIKRATPLEVSAITLSLDPATPIDEGSTTTVTFDVSGGSGRYEYTYLLDDQPMLSQSPFEFTLATNIVATDNTTQTVKFTIRVSDSDGQTFEHNEDITIRKVNNDPAQQITITEENSVLTVTVDSDPDGNATNPNYAYEWQQRAPAEDSPWMDIPGATEATYSVPDDTLIGTGFRVSVTYTDGQGYRETVASDEMVYIPHAVEATSDISGATQANEGDTLRLTAPQVSGGSGEYHYTWTHTAEDSTQLSGHSALTLAGTTATVHVAIPVDFIARTATSATITFKVVVDDGFTMISRSKVVTIHKINNDSPDIAAEFSLSRLSISLVTPDMDGEGSFSLQWQSQVPEGEWMNITDATMATYSLPTNTNGSTRRYRAVNIRYTDGQGFVKDYGTQGPFPGAIEATSDISGVGQVDEGETLILTAPTVSGGSGEYNYTWTQTAEDSTQLSGKSTLTLTGDSATLESVIPIDFIALAATSATITFKVVVDDGFTMTSRSKVVTIHKINNDSPTITAEVSLARLSISLVAPDADGDGHLSLQWQSQVSEGEWMNIDNATMPSYSVPTVSNENIRYRAVKISYTDGQGYVMNYDDQGPFLGDTMLMGDISIEGPANEGSTFTLTAPSVSGGLAVYNYEWTQTAEDSKHLSGYSTLTLTSTNTATVNVAIPVDFIASVATSATITFKVVVDDGLTMANQSKVVTIHKINNDSPAITAEVSLSRLSISLVTPDADGEGDFSLQWQSQESEGKWMDIDNATTPTYSVPTTTNESIRYRAVDIRYTDGQGYVMHYDDQGPFLGKTMLMGDISGTARADEGDTFILTAPPASGGLAVYNYEWTYTVEDSTHLSGNSSLTLTGTTATVHGAIPADFIALTATSVTVTFKVVVDDGLTMTSRSKVVTIHKIDNGSSAITVEFSSSQLSLSLVEPEADGEGNFSLQWQSQMPQGEWTNITDATTATYHLPAASNQRIRYRAIDISYTDGQGYQTAYQDQGPFPGAIEATRDIISAAQANEGDTLTLTAPTVSGGSGEYHYTWTYIVEDDTQLSGHSALTLTGTTATVHVEIPADFITLEAISTTITFKVLVSDGFTMTSRSKVVTIHKINNSSPAITAEVSLARLSISLVAPDADGEGHLSLQWQSQESEGDWMDIDNATMPSYSVPTVSNENIRYRAVKISYTDGQGYVMNYDAQGPFLGDTMLMGDISIEGPANEGSTFTLTAPPASGGLAVYNYEWTQTMDDSTHLSGYSTLTLTSTNTATVNVAIPADFIALAATSATITFKVVVDDSLTMASRSKVVTIHKINNDSPAITAEVSLSRLSISLVAADMDGEGDFRLQWQSQESGGKWMDIANATTATYWLPATDGSIRRYRAVNVRYMDGQGYIMNYDDQGPFLGKTMLMGDISGTTRADEGDTFTLTAPPASGGLAVYNYEWTQTAEDSAHLSGHSDLTLTGTTATVNVAIPADFIALAATSANITFKVVVDDGLTMTSRSKVVTIHKIDNGLADVATTEVNAILMVTVSPDPDGAATTPNYAYQWQQRTPEKDSPWLDINDAIMATYRVPGNTLVGSGFRVSVTYTDRQGYRETSTSNEIAYISQFRGIRIRTKVFLEGPLR